MENRYGHINCPYCDKTNIKSEILGRHLFSCHKSNLIDNFRDYITMENHIAPFINMEDKSYTFCFGCHVAHSASKKLPSKPAIKHLQICSHELQLQNLKSLCATQSNYTSTPTQYQKEIAELKTEVAALRQVLSDFVNQSNSITNETSNNSVSSSEPDSDDELFNSLERVKELED